MDLQYVKTLVHLLTTEGDIRSVKNILENLTGNSLAAVIKRVINIDNPLYLNGLLPHISFEVIGERTGSLTDPEQLLDVIDNLEYIKEGQKVLYYLSQKRNALLATVATVNPSKSDKLLVFCKGTPYYEALIEALTTRIYYAEIPNI